MAAAVLATAAARERERCAIALVYARLLRRLRALIARAAAATSHDHDFALQSSFVQKIRLISWSLIGRLLGQGPTDQGLR